MPEGKLPPDFALVVVPALLIFLGLFTSPVWYNAAFGQTEWEEPVVAASAGDECVLPAAEMRFEHMELLDDWRDEVVREHTRFRDEALQNGKRVHVEIERATGFREKSLTNTCLGCHTDRESFCDRCHGYAGEDPYCWDCHVESGKAPRRSASRDSERREGSE